LTKLKVGRLVENKALVVLLVIIIAAGVGFWEYTGTAEFCGTCHIVKPYYDSWKSGQYLDHKHAVEGVTCDDCHIEPGKDRVMEIPTYMKEAFDYVTGSYETPLPEANLTKEYCLKCHGSYDELAQKTSNVKPNPHQHHLGDIQCQLCHKSHGPFVNHCAQCHEWTFEKQASTSSGLENLKLPDTGVLSWLLASLATLFLVGVVLVSQEQER